METKRSEAILQDAALKQLCIDAVRDGTLLEEALCAVYRAGFQDSPQVPGAEKIFAQRAMEMYEETKLQLEGCWQDPDSWMADQVQECPEEELDLYSGGLCLMAAQNCGAADRQLTQQLEDGRGRTRETVLEMLQLLSQVPMEARLATWRKFPVLEDGQRKNAACLLSMLMYVDLKTKAEETVAPDVSFDAVCVMASTVTETMTRDADLLSGVKTAAAELVKWAVVVMASLSVQYMWTDRIMVLAGCLSTLQERIQEALAQLSKLTKQIKQTQGTHMKVSLTQKNYHFEHHWRRLIALPAPQRKLPASVDQETAAVKNTRKEEIQK